MGNRKAQVDQLRGEKGWSHQRIATHLAKPTTMPTPTRWHSPHAAVRAPVGSDYNLDSLFLIQTAPTNPTDLMVNQISANTLKYLPTLALLAGIAATECPARSRSCSTQREKLTALSSLKGAANPGQSPYTELSSPIYVQNRQRPPMFSGPGPSISSAATDDQQDHPDGGTSPCAREKHIPRDALPTIIQLTIYAYPDMYPAKRTAIEIHKRWWLYRQQYPKEMVEVHPHIRLSCRTICPLAGLAIDPDAELLSDWAHLNRLEAEANSGAAEDIPVHLSDAMSALEEQIALAPAVGPSGLTVKLYLLATLFAHPADCSTGWEPDAIRTALAMLPELPQ